MSKSIILSEIDNDGRGPNRWEYDAGDGSCVSISEDDLIVTVSGLMAAQYEVTLRSVEWWRGIHNYAPGENVRVTLSTEDFQGPIVRRVSQEERDDEVGPMYVMEIHVYEDEIVGRVAAPVKREDRA
jgi:hypothetical protein